MPDLAPEHEKLVAFLTDELSDLLARTVKREELKFKSQAVIDKMVDISVYNIISYLIGREEEI